MSLRSLSRASKKIGFRISIHYSLVLILCAILLFLASHFILYTILTDKDKQSIQGKLSQLSVAYEKDGITAVQKNLAASSEEDPRKNFFVRLASPSNETLYSSDPSNFEDFDIEELETGAIPANGWMTLSEKSVTDEFEILKRPEVLEIVSRRMADGSYLQVGKTTEYKEDMMARFHWILALVMVPVVLAVGALLSFRTLRPVQSLISTLKEIERGKLSSRVPVTGTNDELDELAKLFNNNLEKIEALIEGMRSSLDNVAHDLRTPITRFRATAEMALQSEQNGNVHKEALADCLEESERIVAMLDTLMDISEAETGSMKLKLESINVLKLIQEIVELYRYVAEDKQISITVVCSEDLAISADRNRMRQVLANLLDNAIKYTEPNGKIELKAEQAGNEVVILVKDTGAGILAEELPRIWERLYRSDVSRSKRGLGLGLSLVRAIVQTHGGRVQAYSEGIGTGAMFRITLPEAKSSL